MRPNKSYFLGEFSRDGYVFHIEKCSAPVLLVFLYVYFAVEYLYETFVIELNEHFIVL